MCHSKTGRLMLASADGSMASDRLYEVWCKEAQAATLGLYLEPLPICPAGESQR